MNIKHAVAGLLASTICLSACTANQSRGEIASAYDAAPSIQTKHGAVTGSREGALGAVNVFRGVRYAATTERLERARIASSSTCGRAA